MSVRTSTILAAIGAVIAALLTAAPAQARSHDLQVKSARVAISSAGNGKVLVQCRAKRQCRGTITFSRDTGKPRSRAYKVAAGRTAHVSVALRPGSRDNPHNAPAVSGRAFRSVSKARLKIVERAPRRSTHHATVTTETRVSRQQITGRVTGLGERLASDVRVDLLRTLRGGNTTVVKGQAVPANGGRFSLAVNLGANNAASTPYLLRVSGRDQDGVRRAWYWRGANGRPTGGGAHVRDAMPVRATKWSAFVADVTYSSISGTTSPGAEVQVASPPPSYGGKTAQRELDIASCANFFGRTTADASGAYSVGFLPVTGSANNRYVVTARTGSTRAWYGAGDRRFGSCHDATGYAKKRGNLLTLTGPVSGKNLAVSPTGNAVTVKAKYSPAYRPTSQGDRWIRLREKVPGLKILDAPVVAEGMANASGVKTFKNLPSGRYWVEVGRRTGCYDWFPSRFSNNNTYFKGLDRGPERWKSFRKLSDLSGNAQRGLERIARTAKPNPAGAAQNKVRKGYAGWMYRNYCKARGAGTINTLTVTGTGQTQTKNTSRNPQGAVVKGRIKREKGRTNKEMLVRLTSSKGTRIVRTGLTDSKGTFHIAGLASGTWTISVNSDSWRGIGRTFSGRKSITVKAGKGYNAGTLTFRS
ncbi:hypothetical protein [Aeromicrobium wangtongii]|uniref:hypothetical protein n=1 Tax=Aeromicrobium wangtongii TaxID=2969247 RepID=UPI002018160B|nr:hypothetical protein [Aeromicrobium wangtongii]MCL3818946.1 hypothetical protein [Aeromicrobium wangtongii]